MSQTQTRARRHHYIPLFILRGFADDKDWIWWTRTDGKAEPIHLKCENVFVKKDLYTVRDENGISDRNERMLAEKEGQWAVALRKIRELVLEARDDQIEEKDVLLALEYRLYAGRTPEHLEKVMYGGEHTPREVIGKVSKANLSEAAYDVLENNTRAILGSGEAPLVQEDIEEFMRTHGLVIDLLHPETGSLLIGSYGSAKISWRGEEISFIPVAPDMALFCTNQPDCLVVTSEQGEEGIKTVHKMNTAMWNASKQVAGTSLELLEDAEKRARFNN